MKILNKLFIISLFFGLNNIYCSEIVLEKKEAELEDIANEFEASNNKLDYHKKWLTFTLEKSVVEQNKRKPPKWMKIFRWVDYHQKEISRTLDKIEYLKALIDNHSSLSTNNHVMKLAIIYAAKISELEYLKKLLQNPEFQVCYETIKENIEYVRIQIKLVSDHIEEEKDRIRSEKENDNN
ncbi:MAG: hypothetical protein P4L22_05190 [Candidatus Babeliales bacterium]|nr:hypothetical protein [Candidatus Babeliales bacterium]